MNVILSDGTYIVNGKDIASFTNEEEDNYAKDGCAFRARNSTR